MLLPVWGELLSKWGELSYEPGASFMLGELSLGQVVLHPVFLPSFTCKLRTCMILTCSNPQVRCSTMLTVLPDTTPNTRHEGAFIPNYEALPGVPRQFTDDSSLTHILQFTDKIGDSSLTDLKTVQQQK